MIIFITITTILLGTVILYLKQTFSYWSRRGVPTVPIRFPFGNARPAVLQRSSIGDLHLELYQKLKTPGRRYAGIYFFNKPELLVLDPDLAKMIMSTDFQSFPGRAMYHNKQIEPLSVNIATLQGTKWKDIRQKISPIFSSGKIKILFPTLLACSLEIDTILHKHVTMGEPIDLKELATRYTTDVISSCAFGLECNSLRNPDVEFHRYGRKHFEFSGFRCLKAILSFLAPGLFRALKFTKIEPDVTDFFMNIIKSTVDYRETNNIYRNDFLQLLINVRNSVTNSTDNINNNNQHSRNNLTIEQIAAESFFFFTAGFESSSTVITFCLYELAVHSDIQNKVKKEINDMLDRYDSKLTYDGVMELQYLDKVVHETMRLHPPIPLMHRKCAKDYNIPDSDLVLEEGTTVVIPILGFHSDAEYYSNPGNFDPERFAAEEKEKRHPYTFIPFGAGPRKCLAARFGILQIKVGLIALLKNHKYTLSKMTKLPLRMNPKNVTTTPQDVIWLNVETE